MGRSLSPILRRELENLDKDADSRKSAMKALKSYVKDLDSKAIPIFLAQVSETKQTGTSSGEHTISLYEVLARVHGPKIIPQIDNIMNTIINTLSSSAGAFALHQSCSKVVPAIARYAIEPTTAEDKKRHVIRSLCKPLSDCLLCSQENLSSGSALCLQTLVESDNWRFASNEMVNEVCQRVAGALEKHSQTNSHMALVTALAKNNSLIVEAYARLLIQCGLKILDSGFEETNSQKQLSAIHMVSSLMRCLDPKSILSELELVIKEMEKCQSDRMPFVTGAAFEALQIAKRICSEKGSKSENSNNTRRSNASNSGSRSPLSGSPESQTVNSFVGYDYFLESPNSMNQGCQISDYDRRSVNRRLWRRGENGVVDVSLKDGIFSGLTRGSEMTGSECDEFSNTRGDFFENFAGFLQGSGENGSVASNTPSPQRSNSHINMEDVKIFTTPRKLIHSLQDVDDHGSALSRKYVRNIGSPAASTFSWTPKSKCEQNCVHHNINNENIRDELLQGGSESVSSTEDVLSEQEPNFSAEEVQVYENKPQFQSVGLTKSFSRSFLWGILLVLFAVILCLLATGDQDDHLILVPT